MPQIQPIDRCWMLRHPKRRLVVRRTAAIGDVIAATVLAARINQAGFSCVFQCSPMIQPLLRYSPNISEISNTAMTPDIDLDGCYEKHPQRTLLHFNELFLSSANAQLRNRGISLGPPTNCRSSLCIPESEKEPYRVRLCQYPRPWVFICPRSNSWPNRTIPDYIWNEVAKLVKGTCFWLGTEASSPPFIDLHIRDLTLLLRYLSNADLLVTVDTGPLHMGAALGVPCLALEQASSPELHLSDQRDFISIKHPDLDCLNCQKNICPKNQYIPPCQVWPPELISREINHRLVGLTKPGVSAVIPIFRPTLERLNLCLECVLPQVDEVIVTRDAGGQIPAGLPVMEKVKHVQHRLPNLGFGKNVNFGVRHSRFQNVLILNDDVYLWIDAVEKLKECLTPGVGVVGHKLVYPDGSIQHGGKYRKPGMRGWGHIDHRARVASVKAPMECENVTAASILVSRQAFYDAQCFDEDFFMYAEDDALCLQMRQAGYRVMYTPLAGGTHLESQSAIKRDKLHELIQPSNRLFDQKWGWWITENLNRVPGVFA